MMFQHAGEGVYRLVDSENGIEFTADRLRWERDELIGQLTVDCGILGAHAFDGCLSIGSFNFSSTRARQERSKILAERARTAGKFDWHGRLEEVSQRVLRAERSGQPALALREVPRPAPDDEYDVDGLRLSKHNGTIGFGDGGVAKSTIALRWAGLLAQQGVRTAFFDWETDAGTQRLTLERLFGSTMPDVRYVRCERPLVYEVDRLRRIIADEQIAYGVFDSVGYACAGPPEAAEHAMAYWRAVRQLRIGSWHVAHIRQGDGNDQRPFGSSFWHNSARATWFVKLAATSSDGARLTVGLFNRKNNLGPLRQAIGYDLHFDAERIAFERVNIADVQELAESLPLWQRMKHALARGPRTLAALAEDLGANVDTLDRTVRRKSGLFTRVAGEDGISRIALVARGVAA